MGVHRFCTLAREHVRPFTPHTTLPAGCRVLIDGNGLAFHLLQHDPATDGGGAEVQLQLLARDHGGDYALVASRVQSAIKQMQAAGLKPEVYWDGKDKAFKSQTARKRATERDKQEAALYYRCVEGTHGSQDDFPPPRLLYEQVQATLKELGISQVQCDGEADQELARLMRGVVIIQPEQVGMHRHPVEQQTSSVV